MSDLGSAFTDKELKELEGEILSVYKQAAKDIEQKLNEFNSKYTVKEQIHLQELAEGKITQEQFNSWKKGQIFQGKQWEAKRDQIQGVVDDANSIATTILNGHMTNVFAANANFMSYQMEHTAGINFGFGVYDSATVSNLLKNNPQLLPEWKINEPKDYVWNQKIVNRSITEGIVQGEKLSQIADRLTTGLQTRNKNKMLTFARTAMTGAQNAGRHYSLDEAKGLGIKVKKEWICTLDFHTRTNHRLLDGQIKDNDKPFEINGYKIMYPGDPTAAPEMVYNCRCTMAGVVEDYPDDEYERYDNIDGKPIKNMTYSEWEKIKKKQEREAEGLFDMLDESQASGLVSIFANKKMSNLYNEMREVDTKTATAFYNELKKMGKPSEVWNQYVNGTLPDNIDTSRLNGILQAYAKKSGINIPIPDLPKPPIPTGGSTLKEIFGGKKMSNVYNEMKGTDTKTANQFYKELGKIGKPSDVWQQYLDGKLDDDKKSIIEGILNDYAKKANLIKPVTPTSINIKGLVGDKKMSNFYNELKGKDSKLANQFYKELQGLGKPSEIWQKYVNGEIKSDKIDDILKRYFGDKIKPEIIKPTTKTTSKPAAKTTSKKETIKIPDKNWVEKSIDKSKFNGSSTNAEKTRERVIDQVMKTPEKYRQCFTDTIKHTKFFNEKDKAFYRDSEKGISINLDKVLARDKSYGTLFHETGHAMDYAYMRLRYPNKKLWQYDYEDRTSQMPKFLAAIDKDLARISKEIDNSKSEISMYHKDMWDDASKGVQDFFSALKPLNDQGPRKGKIPKNLLNVRYNWSHSYSYYTRYDDPMIDAASELFANISGGYGDEKQMKYMKKYFSNSVSVFEEIIDEMSKLITL